MIARSTRARRKKILKIASLLKPHILLVVCFSFFGFACSKSPTWQKNTFTKIDQTRVILDPEDTKIPRSLWNKIETLTVQANKESSTEESATLLPIKAYLIEKNKGILQQGSTEIDFAAGGGEIDLKDYVRPLRGSFYFMAEFAPELEKAKRHVYFLSNNKKRTLKDETIGSGCSQYFDITSAFQKAQQTSGFLVNTSDGRHVGALAGTYVFAAVQDGKLYISTLTLKDSSFPSLHCR